MEELVLGVLDDDWPGEVVDGAGEAAAAGLGGSRDSGSGEIVDTGERMRSSEESVDLDLTRCILLPSAYSGGQSSRTLGTGMVECSRLSWSMEASGMTRTDGSLRCGAGWCGESESSGGAG